jgi:hypothetical protein
MDYKMNIDRIISLFENTALSITVDSQAHSPVDSVLKIL